MTAEIGLILAAYVLLRAVEVLVQLGSGGRYRDVGIVRRLLLAIVAAVVIGAVAAIAVDLAGALRLARERERAQAELGWYGTARVTAADLARARINAEKAKAEILKQIKRDQRKGIDSEGRTRTGSQEAR